MKRPRLIVNADDLGLTEGHNRAIVEAHMRGILTSASLLACGGAFQDAVELARRVPTLGIGVHLTLLEGRPVLPPKEVSSLVTRKGEFGLYYSVLVRSLFLRKIQMDEVYREWEAQIQKVTDTGLSVTHLDSHKHIHMHPQLLELVLLLAKKFGLGRIRLSCPPHVTMNIMNMKSVVLWFMALWAGGRLKKHGMRSPDALMGLDLSGRMTVRHLLETIHNAWEGTHELMVHPAYTSAALDKLAEGGYEWIYHYFFEEELAALCSTEVKKRLEDMGVDLIHFGHL